MTRGLDHDVIIVGGGPGGLTAAARLANQGFDVALVEEHRAIGVPVHCTGVLATEAVSELGLPRESILNALSTARFHSPSGLQISYTTPTTEALVIDRAVFDQRLACDARQAGVTLRLGMRVTDVQTSGAGVQVQVGESGTRTSNARPGTWNAEPGTSNPEPGTRNQEPGTWNQEPGTCAFSARAVVLACGASYAFQRRLGLGLPTVHLNSAQLEVPASRTGDVELHFGSAMAPRGFAWAVPVVRPSGHFVRIGLMCHGDPVPPFGRVLAHVGRSWGVSADVTPEAARRRLLPLAPIQRTYTDRLLAVGDAAGLVKPTTGGGIYYSIVSAQIAADVLGDALRRDRLEAATLSRYQARWRERLVPELQAQLAMRMLAQKLTDAEIESFFELAQSDGIMPIVRRTAQFNRHRTLITALFQHPPARRVLFRRLAACV